MHPKTSCQNCVFAQFIGKTQVDCALGRFYGFENNGAAVVEAQNEEGEFMVIDGRFCNAFRPAAWANGGNLSESCVKVKKEIAIRLQVIILAVDKQLADVKATVDSVLAQTLPPSLVTIVLRPAPGQLCMTDLIPYMDQTKLNYSFCTPVAGITGVKTIDEAVSLKTDTWYSVFTAGFVIPPSFIADVDHSVNVELKRFVYLNAVNGQGETVYTDVHDRCDGNRTGHTNDGIAVNSLAEKLKFVIEVESQPRMIRDVTEICTCLK